MKEILFSFLILVSLIVFSQEDSLDIEPIDTNTYYSGFIVQLQTAPYFSNNFYTRTDLSEYINDIDPKSMYQEQAGYIVGLNLAYVTTEWSLKTGLHYSKHNSLFSLTEEKDIVVGQDTSSQDIETSYMNKYQYLHVPIIFGYVSNWGKWSLTVNAGVFLSFNLVNDGLTYDFKKREIISLNENFNNFSVAYTLSANIKYPIDKNLRIYIEPYYISGINSIWEESPIYAWKQMHYGVALGIEFLLNNSETEIKE